MFDVSREVTDVSAEVTDISREVTDVLREGGPCLARRALRLRRRPSALGIPAAITRDTLRSVSADVCLRIGTRGLSDHDRCAAYAQRLIAVLSQVLPGIKTPPPVTRRRSTSNRAVSQHLRSSAFPRNRHHRALQQARREVRIRIRQRRSPNATGRADSVWPSCRIVTLSPPSWERSRTSAT